jgi:uncharacterized membrane protein
MIYTFILALIIAVFVAITINTFYPGPEYPNQEMTEQKAAPDTAEEKAIEAENRAVEEEYREKNEDWSQNVSIIVISAATVFVALGLFLAGKMPVLPNGVLMGGLFTIFHGVGMAMSSGSRYVIFGVVTASLAIIVAAGYLKFVHNEDKG